FGVAGEALARVRQSPESLRRDIERRRAGLLVLRPDGRGVHRLVALRALSDAGRSIQGEGGAREDVFLEFRLRGSQVRVVTDAWFFPEGQAAHFEQARYGELRVDGQGAGLLTGLLDEALRPLSRR